jgi:hypothetical protein
MNLDKKLPIGLIFMTSLLLTFPVLGQVKFEREFRIKETEVPQQTLDFIDTLQIQSSIK